MGFINSIQQYLGIEPVAVLEPFQKAHRNAFLTCTMCGAFVASESQTLHLDWHRENGHQANGH